jgi:hypothetical protein
VPTPLFVQQEIESGCQRSRPPYRKVRVEIAPAAAAHRLGGPLVAVMEARWSLSSTRLLPYGCDQLGKSSDEGPHDRPARLVALGLMRRPSRAGRVP